MLSYLLISICNIKRVFFQDEISTLSTAKENLLNEREKTLKVYESKIFFVSVPIKVMISFESGNV